MKKKMGVDGTVRVRHTAISRKVFGKSVRENPETYCVCVFGGGGGGLSSDCSLKKFDRP